MFKIKIFLSQHDTRLTKRIKLTRRTGRKALAKRRRRLVAQTPARIRAPARFRIGINLREICIRAGDGGATAVCETRIVMAVCKSESRKPHFVANPGLERDFPGPGGPRLLRPGRRTRGGRTLDPAPAFPLCPILFISVYV
ncbi:hypothetical protein EVAR_55003_1 [Eumeta japonica]|uniref:Uncharacterized protein n=1 Tax=Eumeta variegata TaxID=151549 RepID=A0A4C1YFL7_EUMVA|nr:hypothetical protein EVAR_55003_1 [Eumeta japonica]